MEGEENPVKVNKEEDAMEIEPTDNKEEAEITSESNKILEDDKKEEKIDEENPVEGNKEEEDATTSNDTKDTTKDGNS